MSRRGFTLVELLVAISVVGLLSALLFPVFIGARERGIRTVCLSNERQVGMALLQYVDDYDGQFIPGIAGQGVMWAHPCFPYLKSANVFRCPDDGTSVIQATNGYLVPVSYGLNSNLRGHLWPLPNKSESDFVPASQASLDAPARTALLFEVTNAHSDVTGDSAVVYDASAAGNGGDSDCGPTGGPQTYPCGSWFSLTPGQDYPEARYATGNIGGRVLNGTEEVNNDGSQLIPVTPGSTPRHGAGANYIAADGHAVWLRPESVSGGKNAAAEDCAQGTEGGQPSDCQGQSPSQAAGTADAKYALTFSDN